MSWGVALRNAVGLGLGGIPSLKSAPSSYEPPVPPEPVPGLAHTLLQIGLTVQTT
jgi:hypothetical protein